MNPLSVRRYPRASYSQSCYVAPASPARRSPQPLTLSRFEKIHDVESLLDHLPAYTNKNLSSFIADVFDQPLLAAYATPIQVAWTSPNRQPAKQSLLGWRLQAAEQVRQYPALHAWERDVAAAAALVALCGLAGYLQDHPNRDPALSLNTEERKEIVARRLVILDAPLRRLRSQDAGCGSTLGAVLDVSEDEELDRQQVARIAAAIGFMGIL